MHRGWGLCVRDGYPSALGFFEGDPLADVVESGEQVVVHIVHARVDDFCAEFDHFLCERDTHDGAFRNGQVNGRADHERCRALEFLRVRFRRRRVLVIAFAVFAMLVTAPAAFVARRPGAVGVSHDVVPAEVRHGARIVNFRCDVKPRHGYASALRVCDSSCVTPGWASSRRCRVLRCSAGRVSGALRQRKLASPRPLRAVRSPSACPGVRRA